MNFVGYLIGATHEAFFLRYKDVKMLQIHEDKQANFQFLENVQIKLFINGLLKMLRDKISMNGLLKNHVAA